MSNERAAPPAWAGEMEQILRARATSQFVLHGNVFDLVPAEGKGGDPDWMSLPSFLVRVERLAPRADTRAPRTGSPAFVPTTP